MQNQECLGKCALGAGGGMERFSMGRFANIYNFCKEKKKEKEGLGPFGCCCVAYLL